MTMPEFLKKAIDAKLEAAFKQHSTWTDEERQSVRNAAYGEAEGFIDTHESGPYPKWGEGHEDILAGNCVNRAIQRLSRGEFLDSGTF
jgi:hypothetical protein